MIKEYIIRLEDPGSKEDRNIKKACKPIARDFEREFYTREIDDRFSIGNLKITPRREFEGLRNK